MKFNVENAIDSTIKMFNTGEKIIFPIFMNEKDKEKLSRMFHLLDNYYINSVGSQEDRKKLKTLKEKLNTLREELINKYEGELK
jgi:hypothetical protein